MLDSIQNLKKEVEKSFGRKIAVASDCEQLSSQIQNATDITISWQTLRRFWGIIENKNKVSNNTLNILSQYIGYRDYADFVSQYQHRNTDFPAYNFEMIRYLFSKNVQYIDKYELWHESVTNLLAEQILSNRNLFELFVEHLSHNKGAMDYIMAGYQYYDVINEDWYLRGLKTFCNNSKTAHHHLYLQSMEYFACILNERQQDGKIFITKMKTLLPKVRKANGIVYPLEGAVYGCFVAYAKHTGNDEELRKIVAEAKDLCHNNKCDNFIDNQTFSPKSFMHTFVEILVIIGLYDVALDFINLFDFSADNMGVWQFSLIPKLDILRSIIYLQTGDIKTARKTFDALKFDEQLIRFDRRTLLKINYLLLQLAFTSKTAPAKRKKIKRAIEAMSNKTGMYVFKNKMAEFDINCIVLK